MSDPDPVQAILTNLDERGVRGLLMGGQACILYGAAEFSKDIDLAILADEENLARLDSALQDLDAEVVAVPPFEKKWLDTGLAVHFRCRSPIAQGFRIDVMTRMRGVDAFQQLWKRRNTFELPSGMEAPTLFLPDLVLTKKTQRDKDWPMLRRLVEVDYFAYRDEPASWQADFWLRELRDPDLLTEAVARFSGKARRRVKNRSLLVHAMDGNAPSLRDALRAEEQQERELDRLHWAPLRKLLEDLRRQR